MNPTSNASDNGSWDSRSAVIALLFGIALVVVASIAGSGPLPVDLSIRDILHVGGPVPLPLDLLSTVGDPLLWDAGVALAVAALWLRHRPVEAAWIGMGVIVAEALATVIKIVVDRPRPPGIVVTDWITQASFPSGHVTRATATGILLVLFWPGGTRSRVIVVVVSAVVAVMMGLSRIVAGEHWPTDVLGAYLLVGLLGAAVAATPRSIRASGRARRHPAGRAPDEVEPPL